MSRKTVRVDIPENQDALVKLFEDILKKNDGVLQPVPPSTLPWRVAAQLGEPLTQAMPAQSQSAVAPGTGATQALPQKVAAAMRTMYPALKRRHLDLVALRALAQSESEALSSMLGIAEGQSATDKTKARGLIGQVRDALLVEHADNEQALEGYGFNVVIGASIVGRKSPKKPN